MAEQKQTYPLLPISHWWALRRKFRQSFLGLSRTAIWRPC